MTNIIVAIDNRGAIGRGGDLLYRIPEDLKRFKSLTVGNTVVMGRKTFESLPKGALPQRRNIVITRRDDFSAPGAERAATIEEALAMAAEGPGETFIIGGAEIYRQTLTMADRLYLTLVDATTDDADTFFPAIDPEEWQNEEITDAQTTPAGISYRYSTLRRKF